MATLRERDGHLYIVHTFPSWDTPALVRSWYSLNYRIRSWESFPIGQKMHECGDGLYMGEQDGQRYRLPDGGTTKPEFSESEPIPPPKRAKRVRYQYGRWEKYTQRAGWEPA